MRRLPKWLLPVLILAEVELMRMGLLEFREAILILVTVEVLLMVVGGNQVLSAIREYRRNRAAGFDGWRALEGGVAMLLPRLAARLIVSEVRIFHCLVRWALRRTKPGEKEFSYHKRSALGMFVVLVVFVSPVEVLMIEVLLLAFLPLLWLRILVLLLGAYAIFWVLGFYASRIALPHRLDSSGLRLHYGIFATGFVPYNEIRLVKPDRRKAPDWGDGLRVDGEKAYLAIAGYTNVTLELHSSHSLQGFLRPTKPVNTVYLAVDHPKSFVEELRNGLPGPISGEKEVSRA